MTKRTIVSAIFTFFMGVGALLVYSNWANAEVEGTASGHGTGQGQQSPNLFRQHGYAKGQGRGKGLGPGTGHGPTGRVFEMFRSIDKNGDGLINQEEAAGRREKTFEQLAGKGAQALTMDKFSLPPQPKQAKMGDDTHMGFQDLRYVSLQTRRKQIFKSMDQNGDGKVTKEEFMTAGKKRFEANDLDKDGNLTAWEFEKQHQRF